MEQEKLISKRDLLERYGMSYGALYRWKRKGLIPEEWFIKKATVTGQETFFPEQLICPRIELILSGKNELELDALAEKLRGEADAEMWLTISTVYGDRRFKLSDVKKITVSRDAETVNVTEAVTGCIKEGKKWR